jgi:hypothetical protein
MKYRFLVVAVAGLLTFFAVHGAAQSIVSGDITGTVTDQSGAVVSDATVTIKNVDTGKTATAKTNSSGVYRLPLLKPGPYTVTVNQTGFQSVNVPANVAVGQVTRADIKLQVGSQSQTVEVTAQTPVIQTDNGNVQSNYNAAQIEALPSPGGDITYVAQTAPGTAVAATSGSGYGNFTSNGISGTANLFTVNGADFMDPFFNLNNSGASNLSLGANDLQEATVTNNGYTGEYGRNAGAQVNYSTKSGTNEFHGNLQYYWTGAALNARDWFANANGHQPNPNSAAHQWAASVGGPIIKNKTFFFLDTEGIKEKLPTSTNVFIPSPAFQNFVLTTGLPTAGQAAQIPFYQKMFSVWNGAKGAATATPVTANVDPSLGCAGFTDAASGLGVTVPCASQFRSLETTPSHEWLGIARLDHRFTEADNLFLRFRMDHGTQASYTDPINSAFNGVSNQPQYEGQLNYTHAFGSGAVNQLIASGSWYSSVFRMQNPEAAVGLFPYSLTANGIFAGGLNSFNSLVPQGRNVSQYGIVDDYSFGRGAHNIKFGVNFRRNNITDYDFGINTVPFININDLGQFASGKIDDYEQTFPSRETQPFAVYSLGFYIQDQWKATRNLTLTLAIRGDRNSNISCVTDCINRAEGKFDQLPHDPLIPYNQTITTGHREAFRDFESVAWQPRIGFALTPFGGQDFVIRGGVGIFADLYPAVLGESFALNSPGSNFFVLSGNNLAPGVPNSAPSVAAASNAAFLAGFNSGQNLNQITNTLATTGVTFIPPGLTTISSNFKNPKYYKWNLAVEKGFGAKTSLSFNYVGNHGRDLIVQNPGVNGFCTPGAGSTCPGFTGLPATAPDPRFGTVNEYYNFGVSNYNGLVVSLTRRYATLQISGAYTWSHALDEISNGGVLPYSLNDSLIYQMNPHNLAQLNYGNADYDIRNYFSGSYSWTPKYKFSNGMMNRALGGWSLSQTFFTRSGLPYTVYTSPTSLFGNFSAPNTNIGIPATFLPGFGTGASANCSAPSMPNQTCINSSDFAGLLPGGFNNINQRRNQFRGPYFFNTDIQLSKEFKVTEHTAFGLGAQVYNLLNHPNFANPVNNLEQGGFGTVQSTVSTPTSPYGAFVGAAAGARIVQVTGKFNF